MAASTRKDRCGRKRDNWPSNDSIHWALLNAMASAGYLTLSAVHFVT